MKVLVLSIALGGLASASPAAAQIMSNPAQWYINNQIYSTRVFNGVLGNSMLNSAETALASEPVPAADHTLFTENTAAVLSNRLAERTEGNQGEARRLFDSYIALYKQTAAKDGFAANDLAYAFAYFIVNNYHIHHDLLDVPYDKDPRAKRGRDGFDRIRIMNEKLLLQVTIGQEQAIYAQFRESLGRTPEIQQMTDAQKQEATELLAIMFGVNYTAYMNGINAENDAATEQARQMAKTGLERLLGVPVSRIKMTNTGLQL